MGYQTANLVYLYCRRRITSVLTCARLDGPSRLQLARQARARVTRFTARFPALRAHTPLAAGSLLFALNELTAHAVPCPKAAAGKLAR